MLKALAALCCLAFVCTPVSAGMILRDTRGDDITEMDGSVIVKDGTFWGSPGVQVGAPGDPTQYLSETSFVVEGLDSELLTPFFTADGFEPFDFEVLIWDSIGDYISDPTGAGALKAREVDGVSFEFTPWGGGFLPLWEVTADLRSLLYYPEQDFVVSLRANGSQANGYVFLLGAMLENNPEDFFAGDIDFLGGSFAPGYVKSDQGNFFTQYAVAVTTVPEPSSLILALFGISALLLRRFRLRST